MDFLLTLILALTLPGAAGDLEPAQLLPAELRPVAATSETTPSPTSVDATESSTSTCALDCTELRPGISPGG